MSLSIDIQYQQSSNLLSMNCQFPAQGISGIFGPSGAGKTTLLRFIAGLDTPLSGTISFKQQTWFDTEQKVSPQQRRVGFVFQDSRLFPHLDVRSNLALAQRSVKKPKLKLEQLCEDFGVTELLKQRANKLSAGQQQRVAIVRSLLAQPQLLLLDEPLAGLDRQSKQLMINQLKAHSTKYSLPMIYVSHSANEIDQLCDYLVMLKHDGNVISGATSILLSPHFQQQATITGSDEQSHQITLSLTPTQFLLYREAPHVYIGNVHND